MRWDDCCVYVGHGFMRHWDSVLMILGHVVICFGESGHGYVRISGCGLWPPFNVVEPQGWGVGSLTGLWPPVGSPLGPSSLACLGPCSPVGTGMGPIMMGLIVDG